MHCCQSLQLKRNFKKLKNLLSRKKSSLEIVQPAEAAGKKPYLESGPQAEYPSLLALTESKYLLS